MIQLKRWYVLIPLVVLFALVGYYVLTTSSFVRFWADDFCSSNLLRDNGYFKSQIIWWNGWTGRFSATFFTSLVELVGLSGAKLLPIILFVLFTIPALSILGAAGFLFVPIFLVNSPNIIQSFYWMTGSLNYFAPFIFLNFFILLLFLKPQRYFPVLGFVSLFIATGFSEAFGVANVLFLIYLFFVLPKNKDKKLIVVGIVSSVLSLGLMLLAPGNAVRSSSVSHPASLFELIKSTFIYSRWYLIHLLYIKTFAISILTIITGAFVFLNSKIKYFKKPKFVVFLSAGFMIITTLAVVGLTYQALNWEPPERVMSIVNNMIIFAVIIFSVALFQVSGKFVSKKIVSVIFAAFVILLTYQVHIDWSRVKLELKNSVESSTYVAVGKLDGLEDNKGWVKSCIIEYYK